MSKILPLLICVLMFNFAHASASLPEASDKCNISFDILLSEGLSTHPSISVTKKLIKGADLQLASAKAGYYPTPSINISKSFNKTITRLSLDQPLWVGGRIDASYNKAKAEKAAALHAHNESQYKLIENYLNTLQKYLQAQDKIQILNYTTEQLTSLMGTLGRMIEAGELSVADENLLKTKLADMLSSLIITKAEFTAAKVQLEILTGRKIECKVTLNRKPIFEGVIDIETLVDRVLAFHPTLKILDANIESAKSEVDTSKSKLWPSLYLRGEYRKGALYESDIDREESLIYLVLKMSTGAGASALSNVEKSKVKVLKIRFEKLSKEKLIIDKLMNNYTRLVAVITNKEILTRDVEIAKKVYGSNQKLFFLQQKKWTDVVNALTELNKKKISKAQLTAEYKVLESKIALQIGRLSLDTGEVMPYVLQ